MPHKYLDLISADFRNTRYVWALIDRWFVAHQQGCPPSVRRDIVDTAQQILDGSLDVASGLGHLVQLRWKASCLADDPDLLTIVAIDSQGDSLPLRVDPGSLHPEIREQRLKEIDAFKAWALDQVRPALCRLVERYGSELISS